MTYKDMLPLIVSVVRGAPIPWVETELRESAITFFQRTQAWVEDLDPATLIAGETTIELDIPPGAAMAVLLAATANGAPLRLPRDAAGSGDTIVFARSYRDDVEVAATAALKPAFLSQGIPDDVREFAPAIIHGAIARLKAHGGVEWSDPQGSVMALGRYKDEIAKARRQSVVGPNINALAVRPVSFI